jgi:transcriptional regulator with XRE-family HTH domain
MSLRASISDDALLAELGRRIAARRVDLGLTQSDLASKSDVSKRTIERIEAGHSIQLANFLAILRELDLLDALEQLLPEAGPRPMDLLRRRESTRRRVGSRRRAGGTGPSEESTSDWTWDDEDGTP